MKKILALLLVLIIVLSSGAQIPPTKTLVADETWVIPSGQSSFRVITSNDTIASMFAKMENITRFTVSRKQDRHGYYWERSFYFKNYAWTDVVKIIDKLNTPRK